MLIAALLAATLVTDVPGYHYCTLGAATHGWRIVRTHKADGGFAFQSSIGGLLPTADKNFRAYLVWPTPLAPRLWVFQLRQQDDTQGLLAAAGRGDAGDAIGTHFWKNGVEGFDVDPAELLSRFSDAASARLILEKPATKRRGPKPGASVTIDLTVLRAQLSAATANAAEHCGDVPPIPEEVDIAAYTVCNNGLEDATGRYDFSTSGFLHWSISLGPHMQFGASVRRRFANTDVALDEPALFGPGGLLELLRFNNGTYENRKGVTMTFEGGGRDFSKDILDTQDLDWTRLRAMQADGPIQIIVRDARGKIVDRGTMAQGLLDRVEANLQMLVARRKKLLEDPIANCGPMQPDGFVWQDVVIA